MSKARVSCLGRLPRALRRRIKYAWSGWSLAADRRPAEAALEWLLRTDTGCGLPAGSGDPAPCPLVTRACVETALAYGCRDAAQRWSDWLASLDVPESPRNASPGEPIPAGPRFHLSPTARLARLAVRRYRRGNRRAADSLMQTLARKQNPGGGFPGRWGRRDARADRDEDAWAAKYYLDAAQLQVCAAFDAGWSELPREIDPDDGRMRAVDEWFRPLAGDALAADVGCGTGRFLRHLRLRFPAARLTGIDPSPAMLAELPEGVVARQGSLLDSGVPAGAFDAVFAVESLEHSLVPERAVAEICRMVRPGGRVLVIDKHRAKQPYSDHQPWERWFLPDELARWLAGYCDRVGVVPISHGEGIPGNDLFLAASGIRRPDIRPNVVQKMAAGRRRPG
jgi:malonyl-CoA O-methyltransferase